MLERTLLINLIGRTNALLSTKSQEVSLTYVYHTLEKLRHQGYFDELRIRWRYNLNFATQPLHKIEYQERTVILVLNALGLGSLDGPLPLEMSQQIYHSLHDEKFHSSDEVSGMPAFLDIFSSKMFKLLMKGAEQSTLDAWFNPRSVVKSGILSLIGVNQQQHYNQPQAVIHAALPLMIGPEQGSLDSLQMLLSKLIGIPTTILPQEFAMYPLPEHLRTKLIRRSCVLGRNIQLGSRYCSFKRKFTLILGPMDFTQFSNLPYDQIHNLIKLNLRSELDYSIVTLLYTQTIPHLQLQYHSLPHPQSQNLSPTQTMDTAQNMTSTQARNQSLAHSQFQSLPPLQNLSQTQGLSQDLNQSSAQNLSPTQTMDSQTQAPFTRAIEHPDSTQQSFEPDTEDLAKNNAAKNEATTGTTALSGTHDEMDAMKAMNAVNTEETVSTINGINAVNTGEAVDTGNTGNPVHEWSTVYANESTIVSTLNSAEGASELSTTLSHTLITEKAMATKLANSADIQASLQLEQFKQLNQPLTAQQRPHLKSQLNLQDQVHQLNAQALQAQQSQQQQLSSQEQTLQTQHNQWSLQEQQHQQQLFNSLPLQPQLNMQEHQNQPSPTIHTPHVRSANVPIDLSSPRGLAGSASLSFASLSLGQKIQLGRGALLRNRHTTPLVAVVKQHFN